MAQKQQEFPYQKQNPDILFDFNELHTLMWVNHEWKWHLLWNKVLNLFALLGNRR